MTEPTLTTLQFAQVLMNGQPHELRSLRPAASVVCATPEDLAVAAARAKGDVYVTLNPVREELSGTKKATKDDDVTSIRWLGIDVDPADHDEAASDEVREEVKIEARHVRKFLSKHGFPRPVWVDSGNGIWLLYRVDQENTPDTRMIRHSILKVLKERFPLVDTSVFNAGRIARLPGTTNHKAGREASVMFLPETIEVVPGEALAAVAEIHGTGAPAAEDTERMTAVLEALDDQLGITEIGRKRIDKGWLIQLSDCPFYPESTHTAGASLYHWYTGNDGFGCRGGRCSEEPTNSFYDLERELGIKRAMGSTGARWEARSLDKVKAEKYEWLIPGMILRRHLNVLYGDEGCGKGLLWSRWVADLTRAGHDVIVFTTEDGSATEIKPRVLAAGGDVSRVHEVVSKLDGQELLVDLVRDVGQFERLVEEIKPALVVIDPIAGHVSQGSSANESSTIRTLITPLDAICKRHNVALLGVNHTNRGKSNNPRDRFAGSKALREAARHCVLFGMDPSQARDPMGDRIAVVDKTNTGVWGAWSYRIEEVPVVIAEDDYDQKIARLTLTGRSAYDAYDVLDAPPPPKRVADDDNLDDDDSFVP